MNPKKLFKTLMSTALVATLALTALPVTAFAADKKTEPTFIELNSNDAFFIKNKNSGKYLDVSGGVAKNGANIVQWKFTGNRNQQWRIQKITYDTYKIASELSNDYAIDIVGKSSKNGANAQLYKSSQTFRMIKVSGDSQPYYKFESVVSGSANKTLNVSGSSKKDGANINQESFGKTGSDQWQIERVVKTSADGKPKYTKISPAYETDYIYLKNQNSGKYLEVAGGVNGNGGNGTNVQQGNYTGKKNQRFRLMVLSNGNYKVVSMVKPYYYTLDVSKSSSKAGANVSLWTRLEGSPENQQWSFRKQKDGSYKLYNVNSSKALSVASGSKNNGANVTQGTAGDTWVLEATRKADPYVADPMKRYPNRKPEDIDMKALIAYGIKYGESIGMEYDPTIKKGYGSYDAATTIYATADEVINEGRIRDKLKLTKESNKAESFGFWYEIQESPILSNGKIIGTSRSMELYVGHGGGSGGNDDLIVDYD